MGGGRERKKENQALRVEKMKCWQSADSEHARAHTGMLMEALIAREGQAVWGCGEPGSLQRKNYRFIYRGGVGGTKWPKEERGDYPTSCVRAKGVHTFSHRGRG